MTLRERADKASDRWISCGKRRYIIKAMMLYWLDDTLSPSPALGFILGGLTTATMLWIAAPLLVDRPLLAAVLVSIEIAGLSWIWQILYDRYWRDRP